MQAGSLFGSLILAIWHVPTTLKFVAFYSTYVCAGVPGTYFTWFSEQIPHDHKMRGFVIALSNISHIMGIWYPDTVWRTLDGPRFHAGFIAASSFGGMLILWMTFIRLLEQRDEIMTTLVDTGQTENDVKSLPEVEHYSTVKVDVSYDEKGKILG